MREIKFRAWNDDEKKWDSRVNGVNLKQIGQLGWTLQNMTGDHALHYIFMQYTGLKDKNGVEIYEGDIVKWEGFTKDTYLKQDYFGSVSYTPGFFTVNNSHKNLYNGQVYEVIGNIYENPELLNKV